MKLYELVDYYKKLQEMLDEDNVDLEAVKNTLELVEYDLVEKAENIAKLIKTLDYEIEILKQEEQRIANKRRNKENKRDWLKKYLEEQLSIANLDKLRTKLFTISIQNNPPAVEIVDESLIPDTYFKIEKVLQKKELLEALKQGQEIPGVQIKITKSLRIR